MNTTTAARFELKATNGDVIRNGSQIVLKTWFGSLALAYVIDIQADIKNGRPGADIDNDPAAEYGSGWCYESQIVAVVPAGVPGEWFADFLEAANQAA